MTEHQNTRTPEHQNTRTPEHQNTRTPEHRLFKGLKLFILFWMLMKTDVGWGQCENACSQFITNQNLELDANIPNPIPPVPAPQSATSFQNGWVNSWFVSHGSPHHIQFDPNYNGSLGHCILNWQIKNGTEIPCIVPTSEGIFTSLYFNSLDDYNLFCLDFDVKTIDCFNTDIEINFIVSLTNELVALLPDEDAQIPTPLVFQEEILFDEIIDERGIFHYSTSFIPSQLPTYNQLWIYGQIVENSPGVTPIQFQNINLACTTISLSDIATCNFGTSVSFEAVNESNNHPFTEFEWDFGDGQTSTLATPTHAYASSGMYNVCLDIKNNIGCCARICKQIQVYEQLIDIRTNYCSSYTFSIENPDPSMTYAWTISGGSPSSGTGTSFTSVLPMPSGFYTVSVTGQNSCGLVTSTTNVSYECSLDPPSCINQINCVQIGNDINSVTLLSDLVLGDHPIIPSTQIFWGRTISDLCFTVEGTLVIDISIVSFENTKWFMGPGAEIEITPFGVWGSRTFTDSHFQGCTQMWRGIVVEANTPSFFGSGGVSFVRTTIEDAWRGVEVGNYSTLISDQCNFFDNYIGIHFPIQGQKQNHVEIKGSVFESTFNMLQSYPGQTSWKPITWKGIDVNSVNFVNIVSNPLERNIFRNVEIGIWGSRSNINVWNAEFINTTNMSNLSRGIVLNPVSRLSYIQQCDFRNLDKSIELKNGEAPGEEEQLGVVNIIENFFFFDKGSPTVPGTKIYGIEARGLTNYSVNITNTNTFYYDCDRGHAIELVGTGGLSRFNILGNDFILNNGEEFSGIRITNHDYKSKIHNNTIKRNGTPTYFPAISIKDCSNVEVTSNIMDTDDEIEFAVGISYQGLNRCLFKNNQIWHPHVNGISGFGSSNTHILGFCCNTMPIPYPSNNRSFYFHGEFGESRIRQNSIFSLQLNGNFGVQQDAGNIWDGDGTRAEINNPVDAQFNIFTTQFSVPGAVPDNIIPGNISSSWFLPSEVSNPECQTTPDCGISPFNFQNDDPDLTDSGPDPQDPPIIIVDPARPTCQVIKDLYKRLENVDSLANPVAYWSVISIIHKWKIWKGEAWIQSCLDSTVSFNPDITPWYDAEKEKDGVYKANQAQRQAMAPFMEDIIILADSIMQIQLDSILIMTATDVQLYEDLEDALNLYQTGVNDYNQAMIDRATDLLPDLILLPTPLPFLYDLKKVWIAEMKVVIGGTSALDSIEWGEIEEIALKCPFEFGQAVYDAQSLLQKINIEIETDLECEFSTPKTKSSKTQSNEIIVSPNPGVGIFDFVWGKEMIGDQILLFNTNGEQVFRKSIDKSQTKVSIDISGFMSGMYIWEIVFKNDINQTGKIIKI